MDKKNAVIAVLAVIAVIGIGLYIVRAPATHVDPETGKTVVGSVASPYISSPYMVYGDVYNWAGHTESLTQASTTPCAIQSPTATSTLVFGGIKLNVSSTTASRVTLAKSSTQYATTTLLGFADLAAGAQATVVASTSFSGIAGADGALVFSPGQWFVVGMSGGTGTFSPTGSCSVQWSQV